MSPSIIDGLTLIGSKTSRVGSSVDNHLHLVEAAGFGEQAAGELQPSQRRLSWLRDGQRRIAHVFQ